MQRWGLLNVASVWILAAIMFKGRVKHYYSHDDRLSISALGETCGICSFETVKQGPWRRFCPVKAKTICQFRSKYWSQFIFMLEPQLPHLPLMQQRHNMKMSSHTALWVSVHNTCMRVSTRPHVFTPQLLSPGSLPYHPPEEQDIFFSLTLIGVFDRKESTYQAWRKHSPTTLQKSKTYSLVWHSLEFLLGRSPHIKPEEDWEADEAVESFTEF